MDILRRDRLGTGILQHVGDEDNVRAIMGHRTHTGGSDGILVGAKPHPRAWGTFPRYLGHYCRDLGLLTLEETVHHLTGRAACRLKLHRRGLVRAGYAADLVLFDPDTVRDTADLRQSAADRLKVSTIVLVNGTAAHRRRRAHRGAGRSGAAAHGPTEAIGGHDVPACQTSDAIHRTARGRP